MRNLFSVMVVFGILVSANLAQAGERTKYTKHMIAQAQKALEVEAICDGLDTKVKESLAAAKKELESSGKQIDQASFDAVDKIAQKCYEKIEIFRYLQTSLGDRYYFGGLGVQVGVEVNLGRNIGRFIGSNVGGAYTRGVIIPVGAKINAFQSSTLTITPVSLLSAGKTIPIEPVINIVAYVAPMGVSSISDFSGDYIRAGFDMANPLVNLFQAKTSTDLEVMVNAHSGVYAVILPFATTKYSGPESVGAGDLHAGWARVTISNPGAEGQLPPEDKGFLPSYLQDLTDFYNRIANGYL